MSIFDISTKKFPNMTVIVDDRDDHILTDRRWTPFEPNRGQIYVHRKENRKQILLHRVIVGARRGEIVDHINRDTLDNRRCNLRIVTASGNCRNRAGYGESIYRGVHRHRDKWTAEIRAQGRSWALGSYGTEIEAAAAYDDALAYFGLFEFAPNLPDRNPVPTKPQRRAIAPLGHPGVRRLPSGRFGCRVILGGRRFSIGTFATAAEAAEAARSILAKGSR